MTYDSVGRVTTVRFVDADGNILKHKTMEYDGYSRMVKTVETVEAGETVEINPPASSHPL